MAEFHGPGLKGELPACLPAHPLPKGDCVVDLSHSVADTELARSLVTLLRLDSPVAGLCSVDPHGWAPSS